MADGELSWEEAILRVLQDRKEPMHYTEIAEAIVEQGLRTQYGATPATSVATTITRSFQVAKEKSPFIRVERGRYALRRAEGVSSTPPPEVLAADTKDDTGLINAFGMFWSRAQVLWISATPKILGQQQTGSSPVDFCNQRGVYLLHDGRAVVYVGRTTNQALGVRLRQHVTDRLNGRWDRFSWFGVYPVTEKGSLDQNAVGTYDIDTLIVTMEALLIEGLEPPQNRKRGDDFRAVEFLQVEDPQIQKSRIVQLMEELKSKLA